MRIALTGLRRYPVKSCRGEELAEAVVEPWGLAGDRRWMLVGADGDAITAREVNALLLVRPEITATGLRVSAPGQAPLEVARPDAADQRPVALWASRLTAAHGGARADAWFSAVTGREAHLVWLDDPGRRHTDAAFGRDDDVVSFADGYPALLASESSLAALDDEVLAADDLGGAEKLSMTRFRPNLVVAGAPAWAEDDWRVLRVGESTWRVVKGCARCVMTTVDPDTVERGREPIRSLARIRRFDAQTWFGVNLVPDTPGALIRVGDEVEVLDQVESGAGPLRP